jgi:hypothetical protein
MFDAGVESPLDELLGSIRLVASGLNVERLDVRAATAVVEQCAEAERILAALRVTAAATLQNSAVWRREGFRSVAAWMAAKTGTAVGPAIDAVEMAEQLADLPQVSDAFRAGRLSAAQAVEIVDVASEAREVQEQLVDAAGKLSLKGLREECRRVKASLIIDEDDRYRRVHRERRIRAWTDRHEVGHLSATMTADALARVMNVIDGRAGDIMVDAVRGGWFESTEAHRVDALLDLLRPAGAEHAGPDHMVHVVVDHEALVRGHTVAGEQCEIPGFGPVPVTVARKMSQDAILKVILTRGVDVVGVAHGGRTIPAHLRSALEIRDPKCIVPRCDVRRNLQVDHRDTWSRTRTTKLDDLARLCPWHHHQKTFLGYTYRGGPGTWQWIPPADRDQDLSPLRREITNARRC